MKFLITWRVPKTIQWLIKVFFIYLIIFTAFRVATVIFFMPTTTTLPKIIPAFWLGLKYDLRWISLLISPIAFFSLFPKLSPFFSERGKKFWTIYLGIVTLLVLFFYGADFGQFAYLSARLNADALVFVRNPKESLQLVWQSYPVIWIVIGISGAVLMMIWLFKRGYKDVQADNSEVHKFDYKRRWSLLALLVLGWFMYGFLTYKPLNLYRAFNLNSEFSTNLALNPMQNFFTTLGLKKSTPVSDAKKYYNTIAKFLGFTSPLPDEGPYARMGSYAYNAVETMPNIVLVVCESFSVYKSSLGGNKLQITPYLNHLSNKSISFNRCFAPVHGTARGIYSLLTGVPDVQGRKFSILNPETIRQQSILNSLTGYDKFYFLGGRSKYNNLNELVANIQGIRVYDEEKLNSPLFGVWGVSDKHLLLEANRILSHQKRPFFSIIQLANNQRPYAIPPEDSAFRKIDVLPNMLKENGFESIEELRSFAYTDFCIEQFVKAAEQSPFFQNTIFIFTSDHGLEGDTGNSFPKAWSEQRLGELHIPLLFYAPMLLKPEVHNEVVSQIDILPTIAALIKHPYVNTSLGRNILDKIKAPDAAFTMYYPGGWIGVVTNDFYYRKNIHILKEELSSLNTNGDTYTAYQQDSVKHRLSLLTEALYNTSRWMLFNNAPR